MATRNLTDAELALLKTELDTDPLGKGYAALSDHDAADVLSAVDATQDFYVPLEPEVYLAWAAGNRRAWKLQSGRALPDNNTPQQVTRNAVEVLLLPLENGATLLDIQAADINSALNTLVTEGVLEPGDRGSLKTLARPANASRIMAVLGRAVRCRTGDVTAARALP